MEVFEVSSTGRVEFIDITERVRSVVRSAGAKTGICVVYVPHTTAAVTVNESYDPDVASDIIATLGRLIPHKGPYRHGEGNSDAHVKASLVGSSETIPIADGKLDLGTWQGIFFAEFDGPRRRRVRVTVTPA